MLGNIVIAMLIGSVFILIQGENPITVYYYLIIQPLSDIGGIIKLLAKATPLIFTGLAALVCFRCQIFNVGVEGQLYLGALAGALVLLFVKTGSAVLLLIMACVAAMVAGGLWAMLAGWLKTRFGVHEVISTIMLNYVATSILTYVVVDHLKRADGNYSRTEAFQTTFTKLAPPEQLNTGFFIALFAVVVVFLLVVYTPTGWRIDAVGKNLESTRYSGINSKTLVIIVMAISGMLAGLCGIERVAGVYGYLECGFSPGYGYDGMIVAIIGRNNPFGALIAALFFGLLYSGGVAMNMYTNVPTEWVYVLISIMFILVAAQDRIIRSSVAGFLRIFKKKGDEE
ncbi:MAG: ABC transporter permease [Christensenella sp.]